MKSYFNCKYCFSDKNCAIEERFNRVLVKCYEECVRYNKCINCNGYEYRHFCACIGCEFESDEK